MPFDFYTPWRQGQNHLGNYQNWVRMAQERKEREEDLKIRRQERREDVELAGFERITGDPPLKPDVTIAGAGYKRPSLRYVPNPSGDGGIIMYGNKSLGQYSSAGKYKPGEVKEFKVGDNIITGIYTGNQGDKLGDLPGWVPVISAGRYKPGVNVNIDMSPKTKADLEGQIISGMTILDNLKRIDKIYTPEFLTYKGQGKAWLQEKGSKLGFDVGEFVGKREKWKMEVDQQMLKWRKFITGVAGGEKEMQKIEQTTLNAQDSPATYEAKRKQIEIMTRASIARADWLRKKGFGDVSAMSPSERSKLLAQYPLEDFGYEDVLTETEEGKETYEYEYIPGVGVRPVLR